MKNSTALLMLLSAAIGFFAAVMTTIQAQPPALELITPAVPPKRGPLAIPPLTPRSGEFVVLVLDAIDGDTLRVAFLYSEIVRLNGINAPEIHDPAGRAAKAWLEAKLPKEPTAMRVVGKEKYGRILGVVFDSEGNSLSEELIKAGHAKPWNGVGARP